MSRASSPVSPRAQAVKFMNSRLNPFIPLTPAEREKVKRQAWFSQFETDTADETEADAIERLNDLRTGIGIFTAQDSTTWLGRLNAVMSTATAGAGESLMDAARTDPAGVAQKCSAAIIQAITTGELPSITGMPDSSGAATKYSSSSDDFLTRENLDGDKFNFKPEGSFTGVLIVQRKDKDGNLDPKNVDTVVFDNGKVVEVLPGNDALGLSRIGNLDELAAKKQAVERSRAGSMQPTQTRGQFDSVARNALSAQETAGRDQVQAEAKSAAAVLHLAHEALKSAQSAEQQLRRTRMEAQAAQERQERLRAVLQAKAEGLSKIRDRMQAAASREPGDPSMRAGGGISSALPKPERARLDAFHEIFKGRVRQLRAVLSSNSPDSAKAASDEPVTTPGVVAIDAPAQAKAMQEVRDKIATVAARLEPPAEGQPALTSKDLEELGEANLENLRTITSAISNLHTQKNALLARMAKESDKEAEKKELDALITENVEAISKWNELKKERQPVEDRRRTLVRELPRVHYSASRQVNPEAPMPSSTPIAQRGGTPQDRRGP